LGLFDENEGRILLEFERLPVAAANAAKWRQSETAAMPRTIAIPLFETETSPFGNERPRVL
jgi:hypothetical protein